MDDKLVFCGSSAERFDDSGTRTRHCVCVGSRVLNSRWDKHRSGDTHISSLWGWLTLPMWRIAEPWKVHLYSCVHPNGSRVYLQWVTFPAYRPGPRCGKVRGAVLHFTDCRCTILWLVWPDQKVFNIASSVMGSYDCLDYLYIDAHSSVLPAYHQAWLLNYWSWVCNGNHMHGAMGGRNYHFTQHSQHLRSSILANQRSI